MRKIKILSVLLAITSCSCEHLPKIDTAEGLTLVQEEVDKLVSPNQQIYKIEIEATAFSPIIAKVSVFRSLDSNIMGERVVLENGNVSINKFPVFCSNNKHPYTMNLQRDIIPRLDSIKQIVPDGFQYQHITNISYIADSISPSYFLTVFITTDRQNVPKYAAVHHNRRTIYKQELEGFRTYQVAVQDWHYTLDCKIENNILKLK